MSTGVVQLATDLVNIESISGNESAVGFFLEKWLVSNGWFVTRQHLTTQSETDRFNLYAKRWNNERTPKLIFNTHMDTVPPFFPAKITGKVLSGRGSVDAKGILASQVCAAQQLVKEGIDDIGLLFVVGEEVDHSGIIRSNDLKLQPEFLVVGEPSESKLITMQKGMIKLILRCEGKAAHSGYPHLGESAIDKLLDILQDLRTEKWPSNDFGITTMNIGTIEGGVAANVVPAHAECSIMFRLVSDPDAIFSRITQLVNDRASIQLIAKNGPVVLNTVPGFVTEAVSYNTDIPYFKFDGKPFLYGPGSITVAHTEREAISIEELESSVGEYVRLAKELLMEKST